ncbi:MAG: DUF5131 family protein [Clostridia bacterium]|nr:DUF5131 family protein [Clostridia bacterium]
MDAKWNPWHGCHKLSEGCRNCFVYSIDARHEKDASEVRQNLTSFRLPLARNRRGEYKYPAGTVFYTCFSSDFFLEDADVWRDEMWKIMRERSDCFFFIITKRIDRFSVCVPDDWGDGYANVTVAVTCEDQKMADYRLPIYLSLPIRTKVIICEPFLEAIDLSEYLSPAISEVSVGGESGLEARPCRYEWVLGIREQCVAAGVSFTFRQTGARFIKDGRLYLIPKPKQHEQARRAGIDYSV